MNNEKNVVILDRGNNTSCAVNLHGATIVSWIANTREQLFVGRQVIFDGKEPIRGGIPFIFPHFGPWTFGPNNGFARVARWELTKKPQRGRGRDRNIEATFSLKDTEYTRSMWNFRFSITYTIKLLEKELQFRVSINNPSKELTLRFNFLLNMYFKIHDLPNCEITGLKGCSFIDQTREGEKFEDKEGSIKINDWIDRIYTETPDELTVSNVASGYDMEIKKNKLPDVMIWNPWSDHEQYINQLGDDEHKKMVCVEVGHIQEKISLLPGQTYEAAQKLSGIY